MYFLEVDNGSEDDDQSIENQDEDGGDEHEKRSATFPSSLLTRVAYPFLLLLEIVCEWSTVFEFHILFHLDYEHNIMI